MSANRLNLDNYRAAYRPRIITINGTDYEVPKLTFNAALELDRTFRALVAGGDAETRNDSAILDKLAELTGIAADVLGTLSMDEMGAVTDFLSRSQGLDRKRLAESMENGTAASSLATS